jgi:PP-loop superfamily ATP-utilizing enzyme
VKTIVAFSGGNDSTAMALRMAELGEDFECLFTPAGNEPPELWAHVDSIIAQINRPLVKPPNLSLMFWIQKHQALPNFRQRWCTRQIKIEPCIAYLMKQTDPVLCVGLRADEEDRQGLYGSYATYRYPLREWGWAIRDVRRYLDERGVVVPERTNCMLCYDQRLSEWWELWKTKPEEWDKGELLEAQMAHTFRSAHRDTWPAGLKELRQRFEAGHIPQGVEQQLSIFDGEKYGRCRVCQF